MTKRMLAALGLILCWSAIAGAQVYMIHGLVSAPSKKPVGGFDVFLNVRDGSKVIAHTEANKSGDFVFTNLPAGDYDIVIRLDGFRESQTPVQVGNVTILHGAESPFQSVSIILVPDSRSRRQVSERDAFTTAIVNEYAKGLEELDKKHFDLAIGHLEQVVKQVPEYSDAHLSLGFAYQEISLRSQAETEFRMAQTLKVNSARPLVALGRLFVEEAALEIQSGARQDAIQFKLAQAREALNQGISIDEKIATGFYYLGAVDFYSSEYMSAERELKQALELDPALSAARLLLINVYIRQNRLDVALDNLDQFLLENPSSTYRQEAEKARTGVLHKLQTVMQTVQ